MALAMLAYTVIAVLHGMAPQLWARHYSDNADNGPFRVLIFTLFAALCLTVDVLSVGISKELLSLINEKVRSEALWSRWLLRGPPRSAWVSIPR